MRKTGFARWMESREQQINLVCRTGGSGISPLLKAAYKAGQRAGANKWKRIAMDWEDKYYNGDLD